MSNSVSLNPPGLPKGQKLVQWQKNSYKSRLPRTAKEYAEGWESCTYQTAHNVLIYWLLFSETDNEFANLWWSRFDSDRVRLNYQSRYLYQTPDMFLLKKHAHVIEDYIRTGHYQDAKDLFRLASERIGTPVWDSQNSKQYYYEWQKKEVLDLQYVDKLFTDLGIELINIDHRAFICPTTDCDSEKELRSLSNIPLDMSYEQIKEMVEQMSSITTKKKKTKADLYQLNTRIIRFLEVQAHQALKSDSDLLAAVQTLNVH